jgi:serine/threonine-protein kinase
LDLTNPRDIIGTPKYMSPEQARCLALDERSDIYSFGVVFYEMVSGRVPFDFKDPISVLRAHVEDRPQAPRELRPELRIPQPFEAMILKCMRKRREERYQSMRELLGELERMAVEMDRDGDVHTEMIVLDERTPSERFTPGRLSPDDETRAMPGAMPPATRRRLAAGAVALALCSAALAVVLSRALDGEDAAGTPPAATAHPPVSATPVPAEPALAPVSHQAAQGATPPPPEPAPPPAPAPAPPAPITFAITSDPAGAKIFEGEAMIGDTADPFFVKLDGPRHERKFMLRKKGYQDQELVVSVDGQKPGATVGRTVKLKKKQSGPGKPATEEDPFGKF